MSTPSTAMALLLFLLVVPVFTFLLQPLVGMYSRKHEFEADAYAAQHSSARELVQRAGQAVQGQRVDADARPAALGVLRFASAGRDPHRAPASHRARVTRMTFKRELMKLLLAIMLCGGRRCNRRALSKG